MKYTIKSEGPRKNANKGFKLTAVAEDGTVHKFVTRPQPSDACDGCAFFRACGNLCTDSKVSCSHRIWVPRKTEVTGGTDTGRAAFYKDAQEEFEG